MFLNFLINCVITIPFYCNFHQSVKMKLQLNKINKATNFIDKDLKIDSVC